MRSLLDIHLAVRHPHTHLGMNQSAGEECIGNGSDVGLDGQAIAVLDLNPVLVENPSENRQELDRGAIFPI